MVLKTLQRAQNKLAAPEEQLKILRDSQRLPGATFDEKLASLGLPALHRHSLTSLQINLGKVCNQTCTHCHVDAGPDRRESMTSETASQIMEFLSRSKVSTLDITGGAPEMNPNFRMLVQGARLLGKQVIDRCNLTILLAKGFTWLPNFLAEHHVNIVASLPCYLEENCDAQRGSGVFAQSIEALSRLNALGYGTPDSGLKLDLVYNPVGLGLPPDQRRLEADYKAELDRRFGIRFNQLFTITNMPVSRYLDDLLRQHKYELYLEKLIQAFNPATLENLMCRSLVSVDWKGYVYDCDFNQMLDLALYDTDRRVHISQLSDDWLVKRAIRVDNHCYGCTAGCGSGCGGSLLA
jgi:radical SAM/Cys-rich protein